jgi:hypothetical protein
MLDTRFKAEPPESAIGFFGENPISTYLRLSFFRVSFANRNLDKSDSEQTAEHAAFTHGGNYLTRTATTHRRR